MTDILGPANAPNAVTTRPGDTRIFAALDSWFRDCSNDTTDDGTDITANWLNGTTAALRALWRGNGNKIDGVTPVIAETGTDDNGLLSSIRQMIQRAQPSRAIDIGAANAMAVALSPTCVELKDGLTLRIRKTAAPNTTAVTLSVDGIAAKPVVRIDGSPLQSNDLPASANIEVIYDGATSAFVIVNFAGFAAIPTLKVLELGIPSVTQFVTPATTNKLTCMTSVARNTLTTSTWDGSNFTVGAGEDGLWHVRLGVSFGNIYSCAIYVAAARVRSGVTKYFIDSFMTYPGSNFASVADTYATGNEVVDLQVGDVLNFYAGLQGPAGSYGVQPMGPTPGGSQTITNLTMQRIEGIH